MARKWGSGGEKFVRKRKRSSEMFTTTKMFLSQKAFVEKWWAFQRVPLLVECARLYRPFAKRNMDRWPGTYPALRWYTSAREWRLQFSYLWLCVCVCCANVPCDYTKYVYKIDDDKRQQRHSCGRVQCTRCKWLHFRCSFALHIFRRSIQDSTPHPVLWLTLTLTRGHMYYQRNSHDRSDSVLRTWHITSRNSASRMAREINSNVLLFFAVFTFSSSLLCSVHSILLFYFPSPLHFIILCIHKIVFRFKWFYNMVALALAYKEPPAMPNVVHRRNRQTKEGKINDIFFQRSYSRKRSFKRRFALMCLADMVQHAAFLRQI